mmetsp:Transcript_12040/g.26443  ORF Transcript_12040/g.26443 Transcript_12040/m.26443 type:complete len:349 (-) Transcript_12040:238-1284(-)
MSDGGPTFQINLEIKSNGSRLVGGWAPFTFVLKDQEFVPYLASDDETPRGCLKIAGCKAVKLNTTGGEGKKFVFKLASESTAYVFNARSEVVREKCIALLNFAATHPQWFNPFSLSSYVDLPSDPAALTEVLYSSQYAIAQGERLKAYMYAVRARKRVRVLRAQMPELYVVSVTDVTGVPGMAEGRRVFAYVSGLVLMEEEGDSGDIFEQQERHKTTKPVSIARTSEISGVPGSNTGHVALAASSSALSYISVTLVDMEEADKPSHALGIVYIPVSDIPDSKSGPYRATLPLEPYLVPDLSLYNGRDFDDCTQDDEASHIDGASTPGGPGGSGGSGGSGESCGGHRGA